VANPTLTLMKNLLTHRLITPTLDLKGVDDKRYKPRWQSLKPYN